MKTVRPNVDSAVVATAYTTADILFDWHAFEIPKGGARLVSVGATVVGTESAVGNLLDFDLLFAKSINSVAPTSLGTSNAATSKAAAAACRKNIIHYSQWDGSMASDVGNDLLAYNAYGYSQGNPNVSTVAAGMNSPVLVGEPSSLLSGTEGYQTLYIAALAQGAFDFGTGVILNETDAGALAASGTATLTIDGVDARDVFQVGDEVIAQDGALIGVVKTITHDGTDGTLVLESAHTDALANDDEICFRQPIEFHFGFEY